MKTTQLALQQALVLAPEHSDGSPQHLIHAVLVACVFVRSCSDYFVRALHLECLVIFSFSDTH